MNKKASAIILACIVIVVLVILGGVLLSKTVSENVIVGNYERNSQAFWGAEAAISVAQQQLEESWYDRSSSGAVSFGFGTYSFDIYTTDSLGNDLEATKLRVVAQALVSAKSRTLEVIMEHVIPQIFKYAVVGVVKVELKSGTTVHGDIYVDGDVEVQAGASVVTNDDSVSPVEANAYDANVYYTGSSADILGTVEGSVVNTSDSIPIPTFDWADMQAGADFVHSGGTTLSGYLADGVYYITGDVQLDNVTIDQGSIVAEGNVEVINNFSNTEPVYGIPALGSQNGTIEIDGAADVHGLIYSEGDGIELKTNSVMNVYGSVVGATSDVELKTSLGQFQLYYKSKYLTELPNNRVDVISWKEQLNPYILQ